MSKITIYPYPGDVATSWRMPEKMDLREAKILRDTQILEDRLISGTGTRTRRELLDTKELGKTDRLNNSVMSNLPWDVAFDHLADYYEINTPGLYVSTASICKWYNSEMKRVTSELHKWGRERGLTDFAEILDLARQTSKTAREARGSTADDHGAPPAMIGDTGLTAAGDSIFSGPFHVEPNEEAQTPSNVEPTDEDAAAWSAEMDWDPYQPWAPPDGYLLEMGIQDDPSTASSSRDVGLPQNPNTMEGNGLSCDPWFDPYQQSQ